MKKPQRASIPICYFNDSVLMTSTSVWTYLILPPVSWAFLSEGENEQQITSAAGAYANLRTPLVNQPKLTELWDAAKTSKLPAVAELHIRTASKRYSAAGWAGHLQRFAPSTPGFHWHLNRVQEVINHREYWEKITYLGVRLGSRGSARQGITRPSDTEIEKWSQVAHNARVTLGSSELKAVPATTAQVAWLLRHTTSGSHLDLAPLPDLNEYDPDAVTALMNSAVTEQRTTLKIAAGETPGLDQHATVLTYAGFPKVMTYPDNGPPWAVLADWAANPAFPVEYSARINLMDPQQVDKDIRHKLISIDEEAGHTQSAGARVPLALQERVTDAQHLQHALAVTGDPLAYAVHRLIITAPDQETCNRRAQTIIEYCNRTGIKLVQQKCDQLPLYTETIPGGTPRGKLHIQQQPMTTIAAGMPQATETLGDNTGPYLGTARTQAETPVFWSPFTAAQRDDPTVAAIIGEPGGGKALALTTRVPTPTGWTTMGELRDGDQVFGADGKPCTITRAWPIRHNQLCCQIEFSDGTTVTTDADHQWLVHTQSSRKAEQRAAHAAAAGKPYHQASHTHPRILTTASMLPSVRTQRDRRANYSVAVTAPLQPPTATLPIDPYTLGAALATPPVTTRTRTRTKLATIIKTRRIPIEYLRGSEPQRRALLTGLLDTRGYCDPHGQVEFTTTQEQLAHDTFHLAATLGYKPTISSATNRNATWVVSFTPPDKVFRLPEKATRQTTTTRATATHRYITRIRPIPSQPVRCITVDSPNHLYLITEACIPTHNSYLTGRVCLDAAVTAGATTVIVDPIKKEMRQLAPLITDTGLPVKVIAIDEHHPGLLDPFRFHGSPGEKIQRAAEVLMMLLPDTVGDAEKASRYGAILRAVEAVAEHPRPSLREVITQLHDESERRWDDGNRIEENLATELTVLARMPLGSLCFATGKTESLDIMGQTTILTFSGLDLPSATTEPGTYRMAERLSIALYYLTTELVRGLFAADRAVPKLLAVDEAWALTRTSQGQSLIEAMSRMGRSHNIAMLLASHNVADLLDERITGCISTTFAVHSRADREVKAVFNQLGIEDTPGNRRWLGGLRTGEVLMRDLDGRIGVVAIDDGGPIFKDGMDTNPTRRLTQIRTPPSGTKNRTRNLESAQ